MALPPPAARNGSKQSKFDLHISLSHLPMDTREIAAQEGINLLQSLQSILINAPSSVDSSSWIDQSAKAFDQIFRKKPTVAIVGSTGAGKTSFINAVIDEESLLPTNCMRACTATITEISFNTGRSRYRADIEFLSRADWRDELIKGFQVLFGSGGRIVIDATNEDSEAGIFYSKIRAIYSEMTRSEIEKSTVDSLMNHPSVSVLGQSECFEDDDAGRFSSRLQAIIDSKDRFGKGYGGDVAYWPIIRRVKLLVKAPALSTGVTLVDLPGVQDSTPARAQIAEDYRKTCSGLIVAAPIQRAADDRIAKTLLGPTFRRQLMLDGGYSTMTFVCTKTDELNVREIASSPEIKAELDRIGDEIESKSMERTHAQLSLETALPQLRHAENALTAANAKLDMIEDLSRDARSVLESLGPPPTSDINVFGKRALEDTGAASRSKRPAIGVQSHETHPQTSADDIESMDNVGFTHAQRDIETLSAQARAHKAIVQETKRVKDLAAEEVQCFRNAVFKIDELIDELEDEKRSVCIRFRNRYVVDAIKHDFVTGVRERDQERLAEDDSANWDPSIQARDYDKLGAELPVLTVSSRAYQQKMGRLAEEAPIRGFATAEDTGIPAAVRHCQQLTHAARVKNTDFFLAMFSKLLNSLNLWITNEHSGITISAAQRESIKVLFKQRLESLTNVSTMAWLSFLAAESGRSHFPRLSKRRQMKLGEASRVSYTIISVDMAMKPNF